MTPHQIQIVQRTIKLILPVVEPIAALLYERLFTIDPTLQALFHNDLEVQGGKVMSTIILVAQNLEQPERFLPALRALGQRHVNYGAQPEDYGPLGQAFQWALSRELGEMLSAEELEAWMAFYNFMTCIMQEGAMEMAPYRGLSYQPE